MDFLKNLFSPSGFMPHGYCYLWQPNLILMHAVSDLLIALAYLSIPVTLVYFIRKRRDLPFNWMFILFGVFILACGAAHAMEIWTLWHANYWLSGAVKVVTALASVPTAILLVELVPKALALPSPEAMRLEIAERKRAQEALNRANNELEQRVQERTAELAEANKDLIAQIAQRERADRELRQSEERFRLLVEQVEDYAILMLDTSGRVTSWNMGAERIKGYRADEIIGRNFSCFYLQEDVNQHKPGMMLQAAATLGRFADEGWRVRKDGSRFWANVVVTAMRDADDKLIGFSKITRDLTERKRAEDALEASRAQLAHMARVTTMGELAASIAHEVNQPLTAVVANANACSRLLANNPPDLDDVREAIADIAEAGTRAGQIISRIRALVKKSLPEKIKLDVNEVVEEVLILTSAELGKHHVSVHTELRPGLPKVLGDRVQLQQVVLNLLVNAIEAMTSITDRPRVLLLRTQAQESNRLSVAVQDSGAGLDPRNTARIFDTFFTTKLNGMGMGLSISRSIVETHGGRLWAEPNDGPGATFQFVLPAYSGSAA
jgi:PAS domain S-box-containing protein